MNATLAQASSSSPGEALVWVAILIGVILLASIVVMVMRRRLFANNAAVGDPGSILESMRALRDSGQMTQEEYDRARDALVNRASTKAGPTPVSPVAPASPPAESPAGSPAELSNLNDLRARPGYDLTGAPLPTPPDASGSDNPDGDSAQKKG